MSAAIVALCVLSLWFLAFSLCRMASPAEVSERKEDDEAQVEFLRKYRGR